MVWLIKKKQIKINLSRNYNAAQYFKELPYLTDTKIRTFQNSVIITLNNRLGLQKYTLATGPYGKKYSRKY